MRGQSKVDQDILHDPERMRSVFQNTLKSTTGAAFEVTSCEITYSRQSSSRKVVQYSLEIQSVSSGSTSKQIITGVSYEGERTRVQWSRLMQLDPNARVPVGPLSLQPAVYVPEIDLLVQTFPYDYRLPGLMHLVHGSPELIAILFSDVDDGSWQVEDWGVEVLRYRPDMRAMVRLDVTAHHGSSAKVASRRAYAKAYRENDEGQLAYHLLQALWARTQEADVGFTVAEPLAYINDMQTLLLGEASGDRLLHLVRRRGTIEAESAIRRAARAVAGLHQVTLPEGMLPAARKEKQVQLVDVAEVLARNDPAQAAAIAEIVAAISKAMGEPPLAPTHFDLKQGHMLLGRDRVAILDFDKLAMGNPLVDVANLVATLGAEREGSQFRTERRAGLTDAFVEEYFSLVPDSWRSQFPAHFALAALVEAGTTGRGQRGRPRQDGRSAWVVSAMMQAQRALDGELW